MKKQIIIYMIVGLIIIFVAGYFLWYRSKVDVSLPSSEVLKSVSDSAQVITEKATRGVLPSIDVGSNPLENKPDINPVKKVNPFEAVKTNPFE